uniref:HIRAN domain-containing protein n=1 Tax=Lactuca sativa TaxID=4236 RepID=A0A9R1WBC1_LACSA|nr:hypothetical protein LSAT_V11C200062330 [Lactuca sativa]
MDTPRFSTRSQRENFTFPPEKSLSGPSPAKFGSGGLGREPSACSEIVRFSTSASGEIGRIPNEWSRCLLPLVRDKKVQIQGFCKSAPHNLGLMDTINLSISVYINSSILHTSHQTSVKVPTTSVDETSIQPLPTLFPLLGLIPFKKAEFTPTDLYTRNQRLDIKDSSGVPPPLLNAPKLKNSSSNGSTVEPEETISDNDLDNIVGVANVSELEEMEPPNTLLCELRLYEKQALHFMVNLEKGPCVDDAPTTLHPCWDAYHLADKRKFIVWNKLIQKPSEDGHERGLSLVQNILRPIMLRRTKFSTDREGRPILVLSSADMQVKFDQFVEQGRVLHNYASILELLLCLRQCCDHPFLVRPFDSVQAVVLPPRAQVQCPLEIVNLRPSRDVVVLDFS